MKELIIKSIEKGCGKDSTYFTTNEEVVEEYKVDEITLYERVIGKGYHNDLTIEVYRVIKDGNLLCEIESNSQLTITYGK